MKKNLATLVLLATALVIALATASFVLGQSAANGVSDAPELAIGPYFLPDGLRLLPDEQRLAIGPYFLPDGHRLAIGPYFLPDGLRFLSDEQRLAIGPYFLPDGLRLLEARVSLT